MGYSFSVSFGNICWKVHTKNSIQLVNAPISGVRNVYDLSESQTIVLFLFEFWFASHYFHQGRQVKKR